MTLKTFSTCSCRTMPRWHRCGVFFTRSPVMPWITAIRTCGRQRDRWLRPSDISDVFAARCGEGLVCHLKGTLPCHLAMSLASSDNTATLGRNFGRADAPQLPIVANPHRRVASSPSQRVPPPLASRRAADNAAPPPTSAAADPPARTAATNRPYSDGIAGLADYRPCTPGSA
jgi:hypothetical protein